MKLGITEVHQVIRTIKEPCKISLNLTFDTVCEENKGYITERIGETLDKLDREGVIKNWEIK